jgi:hypothetical protein
MLKKLTRSQAATMSRSVNKNFGRPLLLLVDRHDAASGPGVRMLRVAARTQARAIASRRSACQAATLGRTARHLARISARRCRAHQAGTNGRCCVILPATVPRSLPLRRHMFVLLLVTALSRLQASSGVLMPICHVRRHEHHGQRRCAGWASSRAEPGRRSIPGRYWSLEWSRNARPAHGARSLWYGSYPGTSGECGAADASGSGVQIPLHTVEDLNLLPAGLLDSPPAQIEGPSQDHLHTNDTVILPTADNGVSMSTPSSEVQDEDSDIQAFLKEHFVPRSAPLLLINNEDSISAPSPGQGASRRRASTRLALKPAAKLGSIARCQMILMKKLCVRSVRASYIFYSTCIVIIYTCSVVFSKGNIQVS